MEILHQLGDLFLQAVPSVVIVFLFYLFMRWAFFTPIQKAMSERDAKIEGARVEAAAVEADAAKDLQAYNEALKKARGEIYAEQEAARQVALDERAKLLKVMRSRAVEEVTAAKKKISEELVVASKEVEGQTDILAREITQLILENPSPMQGGAAR
ncbi:MAG: ATP synthase F0 subunit B [Candidatus Acidiferrales bacterium]|jgi:F0F1-type ATP synthase membrane subunit b/b'